MFNRHVFKLLNSYYWRGKIGPISTFLMPIILLLILGNAFLTNIPPGITQRDVMKNVIGGVLITNILTIGFFNVPQTIIEFKQSTLIKRIGSAKISKSSFLFTILIYYFCWMFIGLFYILLVAGIVIGTKSNIGWSVAFPPTLFITLPYIIFAFILALSMGMVIVAFLNTAQGVMAVVNVLYLPISFLSGSFFPKNQIDHSKVLNYITYALPTKYVVDPFFVSWNHGFSDVGGIIDWGIDSILFPIIALGFIIAMFSIAVKKFKWGD